MRWCDQPVALVVEDEPDLAELYADHLAGICEVRVARDGREALGSLTETVDVVLLDRRMPGLSGDEVLEHIREQGLDCRVAMVTALEPDFDVIEMGFDEYLTKPVTESELRETVEQLLLRATYDTQLQELYALVRKRSVLQEQTTVAERRASEEYARLEDRIAVVRSSLDRTASKLDDHDAHEETCRDLVPSR